ncbi:MAG: ABC transporter substrate-binding protein [Candidimonas sp.]|nr:MAG: ABC transporter substrate-binding protein [Candidimonas sp.]
MNHERRTLLQTGLGLAGATALLAASPAASAAEKSPIGNYPKGVAGDTVFVGLTLDLTGPYSAEGADERMGYELAIEQINAGAEAIRKISPLTKKGVLGKRVVYDVADSETKPNSAVQAAMQFIHKNDAMMISGSVSSAVAIALQKVCDREKTLYLVAIGGSNEISGKDCQRYAFRLWYYVYSVAKAIAPVVAKSLGKDRKAVYLVPDYTYGHTTYDSMKEFTEKEGWKTVGQQLHPLGAKDYSSYLINIANSGADTLVVIDYGADAANSIKQAKEFGILEKMALVVPVLSPFLAEELGAQTFQGAYGAMAFWWTLQDRYPMVKEFVNAFEKKFNAKPHDSAYMAYMNMALWADAVERAGTFYPPDVIKSYEQEKKRKGLIGDVWFRAADHQGVANFPIVRGKKPGEMMGPKDLCEIIDIIDASTVLPPAELFGCKLGGYV